MNAKEKFENNELPIKNDDSNVTPVTDDAKNEIQDRKNDEQEDSVKQEEKTSSESADKNNDAPDSTPKDDPGLDHSASVDNDLTIRQVAKSDEKTEVYSENQPPKSDEKEAEKTTEPPVTTDKKPDDASAQEKSIENIEETGSEESDKVVSETIEGKEENDVVLSPATDKKPEETSIDSEAKTKDIESEVKSEEIPAEKSTAKKATKTIEGETPETLTFEQIVEMLRKLAKRETFSRKELDRAQYLFLNECKKEIDSQKEEFLKAGGNEEDFSVKESELHTEGKFLLQTLSEKRKQMATEETKVKEKNLTRKLAIIEKIKELTDSQEDFNKVYQEFKTLQKEWNSIRNVPHAKEHELWKTHQQHVEKFYDRVRLHNEFRDYDFKKNLEQKIALCELAEGLEKEKDVVSAFHQLQKLHKDWRDIGPVARKDRELIWQRFKEISAIINKKYQAQIETLKAKENENYEKKLAICEQLEAIEYSELKTTTDWDAKMREVLNLQTEWRKIGYAPRKVNAKIFRRYRASCDLFFKKRNEYYQSIRGELEENLKKKIALCERAEELKDSTDWRETTPKMIDIQREWKEIGMVPRKHSTSVWKRFISACDYFFEQKKIHTKSIHQTEVENLKLKREVTEKIKNLDTKLSKEDALRNIKTLMEEWHAIGFVPYKEKNRAYKEFLDATDAQYARLNIDKAERKLETFKTNISEMSKSDHSRGQVFHERDKLMRQFERMKSELQTYENNVGFLSSSSKKGNALVDDMNSKIEKIKSELELIIRKIEAIDAEI